MNNPRSETIIPSRIPTPAIAGIPKAPTTIILSIVFVRLSKHSDNDSIKVTVLLTSPIIANVAINAANPAIEVSRSANIALPIMIIGPSKPKRLTTNENVAKKGIKPFIVLTSDSIIVTVLVTSPIVPMYAKNMPNVPTSPINIVNPATPKKNSGVTFNTERTDIVISKNGIKPVIAITSPYIILLVSLTSPILVITAHSIPNAAIVPMIAENTA